jgi:hypothetical protein
MDVNILLQVLWMPESQLQLEELGIENDFKYEDAELIPYRFLSINGYSPDFENKNYSVIASNGTEFVVPMPFDILEQTIQNALILRKNG